MAEALREVFIQDWIGELGAGVPKDESSVMRNMNQAKLQTKTMRWEERLIFRLLISTKHTLVILTFLNTECIEARAIPIR